MITELPDAGTFIVDTAHSTYVLDTDRKLFRRTPMDDAASTLSRDGQIVAYNEVTCFVGQSMRIAHENWLRLRTTTPVLSIQPTKGAVDSEPPSVPVGLCFDVASKET